MKKRKTIEMRKRKKSRVDIAANSYDAFNGDSFDMVNSYGTYNIQPTSDTSNVFPAIAQGKAAYDEKYGKSGIRKIELDDKTF